MKPIKLIYDGKGNVLYVRFSDKKEAFCRESNAGKEVVYSIADDGSIIGFEILNFLSKGERKPSKVLPIKTQLVQVS